MHSAKHLLFLVLVSLLLFSCGEKTEEQTTTTSSEESITEKIPVIFDTDANNELDDQHAMAYLLFNGETFDVRGITVNATKSGGGIDEQYAEAERVLKLCTLDGKIPLYKGADGSFTEIQNHIDSASFDGQEAVDFIIAEANKERSQKLVLLPVGKLTNIALAIQKAPEIKDKVRIVWLGSNYPEPGEYNQDNDIPSLNYILDQEVPFEIVTVRYGDPSGTDAVRATLDEISEKMPGVGPISEPVTGRHGNSFTNFGDYSIDLFSHIDLYGDPPSRALFDMVAVAIIKNTEWGEKYELAAPIFDETEGVWSERPDNPRQIIIWENFSKDLVMSDFYEVMANPVLVDSH